MSLALPLSAQEYRLLPRTQLIIVLKGIETDERTDQIIFNVPLLNKTEFIK